MLLSQTRTFIYCLILAALIDAQPSRESQLKGVTTDTEAQTGPVDHNMAGVTVPLDVETYPVAPQGLELQQVHVYVRHGERTPVGVRMANAPASIPEHWMMCKTARRFRAAVFATPHLNPDAVKEGTAGSLQEDTLWMRRTVERADGSSAEGECFLGELTDMGRQSTYNFGASLRRLYVDKLGFLPDVTTKAGETYFRSTNMPRTMESLQHVIHGLYPTTKCAEDGLTEVLVRNGKDENLIGNTYACKRLEILLTNFSESAASAYNNALEKLDPKLSKYIDGNPIRIDGRPRASGVLDTVRAAVANGVKVPAEFKDPAVIDVLEKAVVKEWFEDKTEEVRKLGMGRLLADLSRKLQHKVDEPSSDQLRIAVHSTHDTGLAALASTLDVFDEKWPAFTSAITFELFRRDKHQQSAQPEGTEPKYVQNVQTVLEALGRRSPQEHFVRMRYQNRNLTLPTCSAEGKHLPGSPEFCTLEAFRERVQELTPQNWELDCMPKGSRST